MPTCKKTGQWKYGTMEAARDALMKLPPDQKENLHIGRCAHCNTLHHFAKGKEKPKAKDSTEGVSGYKHFPIESIDGETDKAFLLTFGENDLDIGTVWVPKSLISDPGDYKNGDKDCVVSIKDWFIEKLKEELK